MLVIEVAPEDVKLETVIKPARGDFPSRTVYEQVVLFRMGGRSVIEAKLSHDSENEKLFAGLYTLDASSYQLNNYGGPELKKGYLQKIVPLHVAIAPYLKELQIEEL